MKVYSYDITNWDCVYDQKVQDLADWQIRHAWSTEERAIELALEEYVERQFDGELPGVAPDPTLENFPMVREEGSGDLVWKDDEVTIRVFAIKIDPSD